MITDRHISFFRLEEFFPKSQQRAIADRGTKLLFKTLCIFSRGDDAMVKSGKGGDYTLNRDLILRIAQELGLAFFEEEPSEGQVCFAESQDVRDDFKTYFTRQNLLDYVYALLYSPSTFQEVKTSFPDGKIEIPFPWDVGSFWKLVRLGDTLRLVHLLQCSAVEQPISTFPVAGDNAIISLAYESGKLYINPKQYFGGVSEDIWSFSIGGKQVTQQWLDEIRGMTMSATDINLYHRIIAAIAETTRLSGVIGEICDR